MIFSQEDSGFKYQSNPGGYVKIDTKDGTVRLTCNVSNLRQDIKLDYAFYVLNLDKNLYWHKVGILPVKNGKCELVKEYKTLEVDGLRLDSINIAIVVAEYKNENMGMIQCPLAAYKNGKIEWRSKFRNELMNSMKNNLQNVIHNSMKNNPQNVMQSLKDEVSNDALYKEEYKNMKGDVCKKEAVDEKEETIKKANKNINIDDKKIEDKKIEDVENYFGNNGYISYDNSYYNFINEIKHNNDISDSFNSAHNDIENLEKNEVKQENQYIKETEDSKDKKEVKGFPKYGNYYCVNSNSNNQMDENETVSNGSISGLLINKLEKCFEKYNPFNTNRTDYKWWKVISPIHINNILYQFNIKVPVLFSPGVLASHFKYRHLILGVYEDESKEKQYVVCGVPGSHWVDENPFGELSRWVQVEGNEEKYGAFGYWLIYINLKTGKFVNVN